MHRERSQQTQDTKLCLCLAFFVLSKIKTELAFASSRTYPPCQEVPENNWHEFEFHVSNLIKHYEERRQQGSLERSHHQALQDQAKQQNNDGEELKFGGLGSCYSTVYKLRPGGYSTIPRICYTSFFPFWIVSLRFGPNLGSPGSGTAVNRFGSVFPCRMHLSMPNFVGRETNICKFHDFTPPATNGKKYIGRVKLCRRSLQHYQCPPNHRQGFTLSSSHSGPFVHHPPQHVY